MNTAPHGTAPRLAGASSCAMIRRTANTPRSDRDRAFPRCPHTMGTDRVQLQSKKPEPLHFHSCAGTSQQALSSKRALFWDGVLFEGGLRNPRHCRTQVGLCTAEPVCALHHPACAPQRIQKKKGKVPWKAPQMMCPCRCASSLKAVVVLIVLYIRAVPWDWFAELASTLRNSGARCTTPGPALEDQLMRLLPAQLASARSGGGVRAPWSGAQHGPASAREQALPQLSGLSFSRRKTA